MKTKWIGFVCVLVACLAVNAWAQCGSCGETKSTCSLCDWFTGGSSSSACDTCPKAKSTCNLCDWFSGSSSSTACYTRTEARSTCDTCPKAKSTCSLCDWFTGGSSSSACDICGTRKVTAYTCAEPVRSCPTACETGWTSKGRYSGSSYSAYSRDYNAGMGSSYRGGTQWYDVRRDARGGNAYGPIGTSEKRCLMERDGDWVVVNCPE